MSDTAKYVRSAAREAWGNLNSCRQLPGEKGIYEVDSWGHGGYLVSDELFELHPLLRSEQFAGASWRNAAGRTVLTFYEFEEDVAWAVLAYAHPEALAAMNRARAAEGSQELTIDYVRGVMERWYPELLAQLPSR